MQKTTLIREASPELVKAIVDSMNEGYSPRYIAGRLKVHPNSISLWLHTIPELIEINQKYKQYLINKRRKYT